MPVLSAAVLAGTLAVSGCSGSSGGAAGTSAGTSSSSSSTAPTSDPTSSSPTSSPSNTPSSSSTSSSSSASPTVTANLALSKSCLTSTARVATATIRWNAALKTKKSSIISSAAKNFRTTATAIRTTTKSAADKKYTVLIGNVSKDMETMASQSAAGKATVSGTALSSDSRALVSYCQDKVLG